MRLGALTGFLLGVLALLAARRWLDVVEVRGRSMAPTLLPGDRLLALRSPPRVGDIVIAADPRDGGRELIKRVAAMDEDGIWLRGDNPAASTDARTFGSVAADRAAWRAVVRYWPWRRAGLIRGAPLTAGDAGASVSPG